MRTPGSRALSRRDRGAYSRRGKACGPRGERAGARARARRDCAGRPECYECEA